jgi:endogenous inhibitor of DNA gyrase (YacG/DUF329 family)
MEEPEYCTFCGRVLRNEFSYCPFCGVQCKDLNDEEFDVGPERGEAESGESHRALHKLEEMETLLTSIEIELNVFLSTRNV